MFLRNAIFTTFSQQILNGGLLVVVMGEQKKLFKLKI